MHSNKRKTQGQNCQSTKPEQLPYKDNGGPDAFQTVGFHLDFESERVSKFKSHPHLHPALTPHFHTKKRQRERKRREIARSIKRLISREKAGSNTRSTRDSLSSRKTTKNVRSTRQRERR
jgi:hypothetical protein